MASTDDRASPTCSDVLGLLTEPLTPSLVCGLLRAVIDPELGVNIVDLGLVYDIATGPHGVVDIEMTLTTPGVPAQQVPRRSDPCLPGAAATGVRDVRVQLVWEPPWDPAAMSEQAKEQLGWL